MGGGRECLHKVEGDQDSKHLLKYNNKNSILILSSSESLASLWLASSFPSSDDDDEKGAVFWYREWNSSTVSGPGDLDHPSQSVRQTLGVLGPLLALTGGSGSQQPIRHAALRLDPSNGVSRCLWKLPVGNS